METGRVGRMKLETTLEKPVHRGCMPVQRARWKLPLAITGSLLMKKASKKCFSLLNAIDCSSVFKSSGQASQWNWTFHTFLGESLPSIHLCLKYWSFLLGPCWQSVDKVIYHVSRSMLSARGTEIKGEHYGPWFFPHRVHSCEKHRGEMQYFLWINSINARKATLDGCFSCVFFNLPCSISFNKSKSLIDYAVTLYRVIPHW